MTRFLITFLFVLSFIAANAAVAQDDPPPLEDTLKQAAQYEWGETRSAWSALDAHIVKFLNRQNTARLALIEELLNAMLIDEQVTTAAKSEVCRRLRLIGTDRSVPVLAGLLKDREIGDAAEFALESIDTPRAEAALVSVRVSRLMRSAVEGNETARSRLERFSAESVDRAIRLTTQESGDDAMTILAAQLLGVRGAASERAFLDELTSDTQPPSVRTNALLAIANLYNYPTEFDPLETFIAALDVAQSAEDRKQVLAAIDHSADTRLLDAVLEQMSNRRTGEDAARVAIGLIDKLPSGSGGERDRAKTAIHTVLTTFKGNREIRKLAGDVLARIEENEGFITQWRIAGPYLKEDAKDGNVFSYRFAPEPRRAGAEVEWTKVPKNAMREPGIVNLITIYGGNDRAAYARVYIFTETETDARLEIGSDDGVKVWINNEVVHKNDVPRGLTLNQDKVNIHLKSGWNELLLKITQGGGDWQFATRIRQPDGFAMEGVRFKASRDEN